MFYEGTEKRLQITTEEIDLLQFPESFWQEMLAQAGAFILSKIKNKQVNAYLLSESSLFIWQNKLLLITCGNTHLVKAALFFQKKIGKENISSLLFHRHQPYQPTLQKSDFKQDYQLLKKQFQGKTMHWSGKYQGDLFFFGEIKAEFTKCQQILMLHGLSGSLAQRLQTGEISTEQIEQALALTQFFPQLTVDQFSFKPKGYSLNAIFAGDYLTIHITPEKQSTYLSLESSFSAQQIQPYLTHLKTLFKAQQSNLMSFDKQMNIRITK